MRFKSKEKGQPGCHGNQKYMSYCDKSISSARRKLEQKRWICREIIAYFFLPISVTEMICGWHFSISNWSLVIWGSLDVLSIIIFCKNKIMAGRLQSGRARLGTGLGSGLWCLCLNGDSKE